MKKFGLLFIKTFKKWKASSGLTDSAALSFYLILSLPSLLLFLISLGSVFLKEQEIQAIILSYAGLLANEDFLNLLNMFFRQIQETRSLTLGVLISLLFLLWSSANLFNNLKQIIDSMWGVSGKNKGPIRRYFKKKITSIATVFVLGGLLLLGIILEPVLYLIFEIVQLILPFSFGIAHYIGFAVNFLILVLLFMHLYRVLPEINLDLKSVFVGSFLTVIFMTVGKYAFRLYLSYSSITSIFGAIGSILAICLWIYYSSIIVTFMVIFTKFYSEYEGPETNFSEPEPPEPDCPKSESESESPESKYSKVE